MGHDITSQLSQVPGWDASETAVPLGGGITNQNFKIKLDGKYCVARFYGEDTSLLGIDRSQEISCHGIAAQLGLAPKIVHHLPERNMLITEFVEGKTLEAKDVRSQIDRISQLIKIYHRGPTFSGEFSPFEMIKKYADIAQSKGVTLPDHLPKAVEYCDQIEVTFSKHPDPVPCHNDLLAANFIDDGDKTWLLDWEYAGQGPRFFDLANLSVNNEFSDDDEQVLLRSYFGEAKEADIAKLKLMKLISDLRESFWSFVQCGISKIDFDYETYAKKHFERFLNGAETKNFRQFLEILN